jgi:hypothetical protein
MPAARSGRPPSLSLFNTLADETLERVRRDFPGWDIYAVKAEFDAWLDEDSERQPDDYQTAFYGFMRRHHAKHRVL